MLIRIISRHQNQFSLWTTKILTEIQVIENLYKYNNANEVILVQVINPRGETRRRPASTGFNIFENSIYASAEWVGFKKNQFLPPFSIRGNS